MLLLFLYICFVVVRVAVVVLFFHIGVKLRSSFLILTKSECIYYMMMIITHTHNNNLACLLLHYVINCVSAVIINNLTQKTFPSLLFLDGSHEMLIANYERNEYYSSGRCCCATSCDVFSHCYIYIFAPAERIVHHIANLIPARDPNIGWWWWWWKLVVEAIKDRPREGN